jgi:hypothetical protein
MYATYLLRNFPGVLMAVRRAPADLTTLIQQASTASGVTIFGSANSFADWLDVNRSQVTRGQRGQRMRGQPAWRATGLAAVVAALLQFLEPEVIADWLQGINAHLNHQRPLDLLRDGHVAAVMAAVEAERAGSYA